MIIVPGKEACYLLCYYISWELFFLSQGKVYSNNSDFEIDGLVDCFGEARVLSFIIVIEAGFIDPTQDGIGLLAIS